VPLQDVPPETDLHLPRPGPGETWDPATVHTYYFGFSIPEERIGAFVYLRFQPTAGMSMGGFCCFRGEDENVLPLDIAFHDFEIAMPWPAISGNRITSANGLTIEWLEPGRQVRLTYASGDGRASFDVIQTGVTPLVGRGQVLPGEAEDRGATSGSGGSEQYMHCVGELTLDGRRLPVDCHAIRDRSWMQVRGQRQGANPSPPVGWSPMWFGDDLCLNQISIEARQELAITDATGRVHRFQGESLAHAFLPSWWNLSFHDHLYRWVDERGRISHGTYQEVWTDRYQRAFNEQHRRLGAAR
jgi:hypothetical protein